MPRHHHPTVILVIFVILVILVILVIPDSRHPRLPCHPCHPQHPRYPHYAPRTEDLPIGKSSVGISSGSSSSSSCWRKDTSKQVYQIWLKIDKEMKFTFIFPKTLSSLNLKESVPRGQQWYKDQVFSFPKN